MVFLCMKCLAPNSSLFFFPCDGGDYRLERGMGWVATNEEAKSGDSGKISDQMWGSGLVEARYRVLVEVWED